MLDISKIQTGTLIFHEESFDLDELVHEIVENIQEITPTHRIHIESVAHVQVVGDRDRIRQVFINLLTNAIKYSHQANKVIVCVSKDQKNVMVSVQDFGIGIGEAHQQKIFERFYQVNSEDEKPFSGLGIGLYITNEIIQRHHGRLWVESTKGEGATFKFTLPLPEA